MDAAIAGCGGGGGAGAGEAGKLRKAREWRTAGRKGRQRMEVTGGDPVGGQQDRTGAHHHPDKQSSAEWQNQDPHTWHDEMGSRLTRGMR